MLVGRLFGRGDRYELDLVELMLADQAARVTARSTGFGAEAGGQRNEAQRQFLLQLGVPVGQGFLFAQGLLPDEFARRLDQPLITAGA